jgi:hypothetical protein
MRDAAIKAEGQFNLHVPLAFNRVDAGRTKRHHSEGKKAGKKMEAKKCPAFIFLPPSFCLSLYRGTAQNGVVGVI